MINEADTCRKYILPKLIASGWDDAPRSFTEQKTFTDGRIVLVGEKVRRRPQKLLLIHPFREGNGRAARILAVLMGLQAGLPALLFDKLSGRKRRQYFAAMQAGLVRDYDPITTLFTAVIERTLQVHEKR